jgi:precorrin-3B methylase
MADAFSNYTSGLESPATHLQAIAPDDAQDLQNASRALNVATSGTVQVTTVSGDSARVFVAAGVAFPLRASRIWSTGTSATGIVVMY